MSVAFVAWVLGRHPDRKFICASYGEKPADMLAEMTRSLMRHPDYRDAFPNTVFSDNAPLEMQNTTEHGYRMTTSVGGAATGIGCDYVIADDMTKAEASESERAKAASFYQTSLLSRFNDKQKGAAIVIAQRTAVDDLPGQLLDQGGYRHLNLPAIAQADEQIEIGPNRFHFRRRGDLLHEARENHQTLERVKRDLGNDTFAAHYLQRPNSSLGSILEPDWFTRYTERRPLHLYPHRVLSVDTALSTAMTADYSVISEFGATDDGGDLLQVWRDRVGYNDLAAKLDSAIREFEPTHIIIERAGGGVSLLQELSRRYFSGLIGMVPIKSKEERVARLIPFFRRKTIRLPARASWLGSFENEVFNFPGSRYDDQLDTLTQFANYAGVGFSNIDRLEEFSSSNYRGQVWVPGMRNQTKRR